MLKEDGFEFDECSIKLNPSVDHNSKKGTSGYGDPKNSNGKNEFWLKRWGIHNSEYIPQPTYFTFSDGWELESVISKLFSGIPIIS